MKQKIQLSCVKDYCSAGKILKEYNYSLDYDGYDLGKKRYEEKMGAYREAIDGLNIREMARNFWTY